MNFMTASPFHRGEQEIQQRLGVREKMERFGRQVIRDYMPEQHRDFYAQLPFVFIAHSDDHGWPWASMLFNRKGFINSASNQQLQINAKPVEGDPLNQSLTKGTRLGLLGIELETRRRNRLSAYIKETNDNSINLSIKQAFGNCPQYIQTRELYAVNPASMPAVKTEKITQFDQQAVELISLSDTFFVASYVANGSNSASEGADVSHRGGKPGFILVDNNYSLTIPDYSGNNHFNTLGNFVENAKAGLLFIDFIHGHMLTLTGNVEILWESDETEFFAGAERLWKFNLDHGYWLKNSLPLRWKLQQYSVNTSLSGTWSEAKARQKSDQLKHQWQPYQIVNIVKESHVIKSFYLKPPADQKPYFKAGQFITLKIKIAGKELIRTYTVSSSPNDTLLRISVKQDGVFSNFLHQQLKVGDIIASKAPSGVFTFDADNNKPAVLISAGIGITPMISMVRYAIQEAIRTRSSRPILLICTARNNAERAFYQELNEIAANSAAQIKVIWLLTKPENHLKIGRDYDHQGRISKQRLQSFLPKTKFDAYLCGPGSFMQNHYNWLREIGVNDEHIFAEAFGPASLIRDDLAPKKHLPLPAAKEAIVTFTESKMEQSWSESDGSLLEFAESHGLNPVYGCRNGQCGQCKHTLVSGDVSYKQAVDLPLSKDEILICCAVPAKTNDNTNSHLEIQL